MGLSSRSALLTREVGVRIGVEMNRPGKEEKVWEGESNKGRIRVASGKSMSLC